MIIRYFAVPTTSEYKLIGTACSEALTTSNYFMSTGYARGQQANEVVVSLEGANLRYKINGSAPATNCGHLFLAGSYLEFGDVAVMQKFKVLNEVGTATAYLHATYLYG
jgi:hypothetical protein